MKKILVTQSNYIPWKGYFDSIHFVDKVILYDEAQFTKRDWRNRNIIKTPQGPLWLTIPVQVKGKYFQKINETKVSDKRWAKKHWTSIQLNYSGAPEFESLRDFVDGLYRGAEMDYLSEINFWFLSQLCRWMNIQTPIEFCGNLRPGTTATERLIDLCKSNGATHYYTGPAANAYLELDLFEKEGIHVRYLDYNGYKEYKQIYPPFYHSVSILDLLFHTGTNFSSYMKSFTQP